LSKYAWGDAAKLCRNVIETGDTPQTLAVKTGLSTAYIRAWARRNDIKLEPSPRGPRTKPSDRIAELEAAVERKNRAFQALSDALGPSDEDITLEGRCRQLQARAEKAEAERDEALNVLREHHQWHQDIGTVYFCSGDEDGDFLPVDLSDGYADSALACKTTSALSNDMGRARKIAALVEAAMEWRDTFQKREDAHRDAPKGWRGEDQINAAEKANDAAEDALFKAADALQEDGE